MKYTRNEKKMEININIIKHSDCISHDSRYKFVYRRDGLLLRNGIPEAEEQE